MAPLRPAAVTLALGTIATGLVLAQESVTFKDQPAQDLFIASRAAISRPGGSVKDLHAIVLKGRARMAQDDGTPAESTVVIKVLFPDAYVRTDTMGTVVRTTGFSGNRLLTRIAEGGQVSTPPASMTDALLKGERARLTRLLIGTLTAVTPSLRIVGRSAPGIGAMERPGEGAPVGAVYDSANELRLIEFSAPDGFYTRFVVDGAKLPIRLEFRVGNDEIWTTTFSDRRPVSGLLVPFRMVTEGRGTVREDLRIEEIDVNPELGKADFRS